MSIDITTVRHIAKLSKLEFCDNEIEKFTDELSKIIEHINKIRELQTEEVKEQELSPLRLREDKPLPTLLQALAFANAPEIVKRLNLNYFVVPKIIDK